VLAATNRPEDLDEACLRRLTRRIYMPLPDIKARLAMFNSKVTSMKNSFTPDDMQVMAAQSEGYSMADMVALIKEMAMMPVREIPTEQLLEIKDMNDIRAVDLSDFNLSLK
jgi:SpoVK/Ycf46/Vps4 family AAA+-type ATPase